MTLGRGHVNNRHLHTTRAGGKTKIIRNENLGTVPEIFWQKEKLYGTVFTTKKYAKIPAKIRRSSCKNDKTSFPYS